MGKVVLAFSIFADVVLAPFTLAASVCLKHGRRMGIHGIKISRIISEQIGVFPTRDHYYEALSIKAYLRKPLIDERELRG